VRQETGIQKSNIWAKQNLLIPKRGFGLNSGYNGTTDQRRTKAGTIPTLKHYMERDLGEFASNLWTPIQITTSLWLDGADSSTITGTSTVSQWRDKSGNARNATTAVRSPSLLLNAQNGLSAISFTAASATKLDTPDFSIAPNRQYCTFVVVSGAGLISSGNYPRIWVTKLTGDGGSPASAYPQGFLGAGASNGRAAHLAGAASPLTPEITGLSTTSAVLLSGRFGTAGVTADNISISANGGTQTSASGRTGTLSTTGIRIGSDVGTSSVSAWNSWIGEIILTQDISFDQSQLIEGYLAWKWGLTSSLPSDHPYKNAAPTV
jgi:hypothetical protein